MGVFLSLKRLFVPRTVPKNFWVRNSTLTVPILDLHGPLSNLYLPARHADIAINMGWQQPDELLFHLRPQFGQIRLPAPIAPPFHIDFVFLIVFYVFRDRIDQFLHVNRLGNMVIHA